MDLFQGLNACQQDAVRHIDGPELVLAGAGSGKTRVLTHRIAYMTGECGIPSSNVLAITFTNKAAAEMRSRVERLCGLSTGDMWIMTFHAACVRILRRNAVYLGYENSFAILDAEDSKSLIKKLMKEYNKSVDGLTPRAIASVIESYKNQCISPQEVERQAGDFSSQRMAWFYTHYEEEKRRNKAMDFNDLLTNTVELFEAYPDILNRYQERFKYILVDEYQDTNSAQYRIVSMLAAKYKNIFVVGDDDQSIYRFRGADIRNILEFEKDFPGAHVVRLEQNYRSTSHILNLANHVIRNNIARKGKNLWTDEGEGEKVKFYVGQSETDEAQRVAQTIAQLQNQGYNLKDMAVLFRANSLSRVFEDVFARAGIPYVLYNGTAFYQRKEVKDIMAFMHLIANDHDYVSMERALTTPPRGIGEKTIDLLNEIAKEDGFGFSEIIAHIDSFPQLSRASARLCAFNATLLKWREKALTSTVEEMLRLITETLQYQAYLQKDDPLSSEERWANVQELVSRAAEFDEENETMLYGDIDEEGAKPTTLLGLFLEEISLQTAVDKYDENTPTVSMMTVHTAKGLEFDVVFLIGMEDGVFPSYQSLNEGDAESVPEERRLLYVAITRAKKLLYISYSSNRRLNGAPSSMRASRFVEEFSEDDLERVQPKTTTGYGSSRVYTSFDTGYDRSFDSGSSKPVTDSDTYASFYNKPKADLATPSVDFTVGDTVSHATFGLGVIKSMESVNADYRVVVEFADYGTKTLFARLAKLKKV